MKAIEIISDSWEERKPYCINSVWPKIWSECVHRKCTTEVDATPAVRRAISNLARKSNFEGMEANKNELITSHNQESSIEELLQLELQIVNEEDDCDRLIEISKEPNLTYDPDSGRSLRVSQVVATNINCHKEIYFTLEKKVFSKHWNIFFLKKAHFQQQTLMTHQFNSDFVFHNSFFSLN